MNEIMDQVSSIVPPKYAVWIAPLFVASQVLGRMIQSLRTGGGLKGMLASIWLGTNQPKDPQPATFNPQPSTPPPFRPPVWMVGFAALSLGLAGCMTLDRAVVTLTSVVDVGMKDWAQASHAGRTTPVLDARVISAHNHYRQVCAQVVPLYEAAIARGENPDTRAVLTTLRAAVDPLMDLLLPALLPSQQATLNTQLKKVNAP